MINVLINAEDGQPEYKLNKKALAILAAIDRPIAVVAVCGLQGTGKSTLLNLLLGTNSDEGVSTIDGH